MSRRLAVLAVAVLSPVLMGTVQQQRERLPPPPDEVCQDPVTGTWKAHVFYEHVGQWYLFRLDIRRGEGSKLTGTIDSEWWNGTAKDEAPPVCGGAARRRAVFEEATGAFDGKTVRFNATGWEPKRGHVCDEKARGYLLDNFEGVLDGERQEFQSLLNADAPEWRDVPTVFRRIACGEQPPKAPDPVVSPPPFQPPSVGCAGWG